MLSPELKKLMEDLENDVQEIKINPEELLKELHNLDSMESLGESLSLSGRVCHCCGRPL